MNDDGDLVADICPPGSYCEEGSISPMPCGLGSFSSSYGNPSSSFCIACPPGYYCPLQQTVSPLICPEGYYCPMGSTYYQFLCDEGYMCPEGSYMQQVSF
jgi:hypothetical protein